MLKGLTVFWLFVFAAGIASCCFFSYLLPGQLSPFINYNSSLLGLLVVVLLILFLPFHINKRIFVGFCLAAIAAIFLTQSRTGLFSFLSGLLALGYVTGFFTVISKKLFSAVVVGLITFSITITFFIKPGSTNGRWFIWQNCFTSIKQNWLTGNGWGTFRVTYNNEQASWFVNHGFQSKQALLADTVYYAFNEWLQLAIETGVPLTLLLLGITLYVLRRAVIEVKNEKTAYIHKKATAAFVALLISTFFSYPFFFLPTLFLFAVLFSWICFLAFKKCFKKVPRAAISVILSAAGLCFIYFSVTQVYSRLKWKEAAELSRIAYNMRAKKTLLLAYPYLKRNGDFLYSMASVYASLNQTDSALYFLEKSSCYKNDYEVHRRFGTLYLEKGDYQKAEQHFLKSVFMVPNRFKSRELLVDFCIRTGNKSQAVHWAKESLGFPVKVPSERVSVIRRRLQLYIDTGKW